MPPKMVQDQREGHFLEEAQAWPQMKNVYLTGVIGTAKTTDYHDWGEG